MQVSTNADALSYTLQSNLNVINKAIAKSTEKMSTGYKINHASDDAAILSVADKISCQISGNTVAESNIQQGNLILDAVDNGLQSITTNLNSIRDLVVQAASTYDESSRNALKAQALSYLEQINTTATTTTYGDLNLLDGSISSLDIQAGANAGETIDIGDACANATGSAIGITQSALESAFATPSSANAYISTVDTAIGTVSSQLGTAGAYTNILDESLKNLGTKITNLEASHSALMDTDYAAESAKLSNLQVLQEANISLMAQLNSQKSVVLKLLE